MGDPHGNELNQLLESVGESPYHVSGLERGEDLSIYRFSAASAAIYFLASVPAAVRAQVRRIVIEEDREAMAAPECHGRGLIPFCQENPLLCVERRVNLWRNLLQPDSMAPHDRINPMVRGAASARLLHSKDVTRLVSMWVMKPAPSFPRGCRRGHFHCFSTESPPRSSPRKYSRPLCRGISRGSWPG